MGLFDFVRDAGEKLGLSWGAEKRAAEAAAAKEKEEKAAAEALVQKVHANKLEIEDLSIGYQDGVATVHGRTESQSEREKVILVVGNTQGVAQVDDRIEVVSPEPEAVFHTVVSGDTLSKIAKKHYGNAMKYPVIFEANKPMLTHPDKIYPGQVLRIPHLA